MSSDIGPIPQQLLHIDEIFAFVGVDSEGESIVSFPGPIGWIPMIGADMARVNSLRTQAQILADAEGFPVRLVKFTNREELELIQPSTNSEQENITLIQPQTRRASEASKK